MGFWSIDEFCDKLSARNFSKVHKDAFKLLSPYFYFSYYGNNTEYMHLRANKSVCNKPEMEHIYAHVSFRKNKLYFSDMGTDSNSILGTSPSLIKTYSRIDSTPIQNHDRNIKEITQENVYVAVSNILRAYLQHLNDCYTTNK
ncbi:hypothetical protein [Aneurinibacillus aneurinilyticus]|uniref:hypothetical protein n=1 Tax=Aneurinibacillus aneurinilyticus TaxID=1391 RepID=UPI0023F34C8E|nr:hypothetical protein [Aneurinibacillus aneurinilyticus]